MNTNNEKQREIINMIITASVNVNSEEHNKILFKLLELEQNQIAYTEKIIDILCNFEIFFKELNSNQRIQILIYMKNFLIKIQERSELKNIPNIFVNISKIFIIYLKENISELEEKIFCEINDSLFTILSNFDKIKDYLNDIYKNIIAKIFDNGKIIQKKVLLKLINLYTSFNKIYIIYFHEQKDLNFIFDYYNFLFGQCEIISFNGNERITTENIKNSATLFNKLIISFSKTSVITLDNFLKNQMFPNLISKEKKKDEFLNFFLQNDSFLDFINHGFMLFSSFENYSNTNNQFFILSNIKNEFNFIISKGKGILLELLTIICQKINKYNYSQYFQKYNLFIKDITENLIIHLINFYKTNEYPREKIDNTNEEINQLTLIVKSLVYLEIIVVYPESNNIIRKYQMDIFQYIIIPNLLITPLEKSSFELDSNLYCKTLFDMCKICENSLPKNKALRLLMNMSENIEGFLNFIVYLYLKIMLKLTGIKDDTLINDNNEIFIFLVSKINEIDLTEQCLQVLTSVSFLFCEREKIYEFFSEKIDLINHLLIKISNNYLKTKLCMFYSYVLEDLFHDEHEILSKSFNDSLIFLFNCILNNEKCLSLFQVALNSINSIIFDKYLKKFCVDEVTIYANKVINYIQVNKMECFENDFNTFVKGIINFYMIDLEQDAIKLFDFFWDSFYNSIKYMLENKNEMRTILGEKVNDSQDFPFKINLIETIINLIKNKNGNIKNTIYSKVILLINELDNLFNWDYEGNILDILNLILEDTKYLTENYISNINKYFIKFTNGIDGHFTYKFEEYHIYFIFTYLKCFNEQIIINNNIQSNLFEMIYLRIQNIPRKTQLNKIIAEHIIYANLLNVSIMFFWNLFSTQDIKIILDMIIKRMETIPNANLDLNIRLSLSIFLLFLKIEKYDYIQNINLYNLIVKIINFFPINSLCSTEQQIIAIFCSLMVRFILIQGNNFNNNKIDEILYHLINLNLTQLKLIKKKLATELALNSEYENNDCKNEEDEEKIISRQKEFTFSKRKEHKTSLKIDIKVDKNIDEDDYFVDIKDENDDSESSLNTGGSNNSSKENYLMDNCNDDKDDEFIKIKKGQFNFNKYYKSFANESLKEYLKNINEFQMFNIMLKDIELSNKDLYILILKKFDNESINLIQTFREYKKIVFTNNGKNNYLYRKIIKLKK